MNTLPILLEKSESAFNDGLFLKSKKMLLEAQKIAPQELTVFLNLAYVNQHLGQYSEVADAANQALKINPASALAHVYLAESFRAQGMFQQAIDHVDLALKIAPQLADAWSCKGLILDNQGLVAQAHTCHQQAVDEKPNAEFLTNLGLSFQALGLHEAASHAISEACRYKPERMDLASNWQFALQYRPDLSSYNLRESARQWQEKAVKYGFEERGVTKLKSHKPIRVAYISGDLYQHPVGWLCAHVLMQHKPELIHTYILCDGRRDDPISRFLKQGSSRNGFTWKQVCNMSHQELLVWIQSHEIDVLVDLTGHSANNRLPVFAMRAAPAQFSWLGYFATTGLNTIDGVLLSPQQCGLSSQRFYTEAVINLGRPHFCYYPPDYAPEIRIIERDHIVLGSFNNLSKVNDRVLDCWAKILISLPDAKLLLKWKTLADTEIQRQIGQALVSRGAEAGQLIFRGFSEHVSMLDQYHDMDIALDTFPFSGGLTSLEALWMGVPLISMPQLRPVSRQGEIILQALDLPELIAKTPQEYIEKTIALAQNTEKRLKIRKSLRQRMQESVLMDYAGLARALEHQFVTSSSKLGV